jgi:protein-S-isoprenylcysteine O-methyltransferase Ste14
MPIYAHVVLAVGWLAWMTPFLLMKRNKAKAQQIDRRARWGIFTGAPIYTSLLCLLWAMGFLLTRLPWLALASLLALIGTEIRVRVEDGLLASRFGKQFEAYQRSVPAYIPLIR